jgi:hypothetical protein
MKDKRTAAEKTANREFIKALAKDGVVGCRHKVSIHPPSGDEPKNERVWTLTVDNGRGLGDVVVAWYKTRDAARIHAQVIRRAFRLLVKTP